MKLRIDLNCDLGESFGHYVMGQDEAILELITSANIACGYHAGDHNVMEKTVRMAAEKQVSIGAHPGLPDLMGFGRRVIEISPEDVYNCIIYQVGALQAFAHLYGREVRHVKPHGALYNMAAKQYVYAEAIAKAVQAINPRLVLFGLAGSELVKAGKAAGLQVAEEVFADRTYQADGTLTPRTQKNAFVHDPEEAAARVLTMVEDGIVVATDGSKVAIQADTICIHGDHPEALTFARKLREKLQENEIHIQPVGVDLSD